MTFYPTFITIALFWFYRMSIRADEAKTMCKIITLQPMHYSQMLCQQSHWVGESVFASTSRPISMKIHLLLAKKISHP